MPVAHFHVMEPTKEQSERLLREATDLYAAALAAPLERVRVFVQAYPVTAVAAAGEVGAPAPYFTALVLSGRPAEVRDRIAAGFTALLADVTGVEASLVRGRVIQIDPSDWYIAGQPVSLVRADEVAARAAANQE